MAKLLLLSSLGLRLPLVASVVAHAAIVAAAVGGQGTAVQVAERPQTYEIEAPVLATTLDEPPPAPEPHHHAESARTYATHTHAYPVPADHDDHPHDPSIDHRQVAAAAAVLVAPDPALPHFAIVLGTADVSAGGPISAGGGAGSTAGGDGAASPPGSSGSRASGASSTEYQEPTVTVPARLVSSVQPEYPPSARTSGVEAEVALEIVVDASGRVVESRVLRKAGYGFDESALRAIRDARFSPAQYEGSAVRVRMRWTVSFRLE